MSEEGKSKSWSEEFWYSGKVTRRRLLGWSAGPHWCLPSLT